MPEGWQVPSGGKQVSLGGLDNVARELLERAGKVSIWLFIGEMGSGKTTLIKSIGRLLGVVETMSSPTFSIVNEYGAANGRKIYHMDLFRLKNEKEVADIGIEEYFSSNELCLLEWPDRLGRLVPEHHVKIRITVIDALHRKIEFQET